MFWDTKSVIPAFRFNFIILISSIFIFSEDIIKCVIPFTFMLVYLSLVRLLSPVFFGGLQFQGDILLALLTGGTLFISVFILNWYGTTPVTLKGRFIYGFFAGILNFFISGCGTSSSGLLFTVLIVNIVSVIIQQTEAKMNLLRTKRIVEKFNAAQKKEE